MKNENKIIFKRKDFEQTFIVNNKEFNNIYNLLFAKRTIQALKKLKGDKNDKRNTKQKL